MNISRCDFVPGLPHVVAHSRRPEPAAVAGSTAPARAAAAGAPGRSFSRGGPGALGSTGTLPKDWRDRQSFEELKPIRLGLAARRPPLPHAPSLSSAPAPPSFPAPARASRCLKLLVRVVGLGFRV